MGKEYSKAFFFCKRWAKSPSTSSYTKSYSRGNADKDPAKIVYEHIIYLQENKLLNYKGKLDELDCFLENKDKLENEKTYFQTGFYRNLNQYIRAMKINIEKGLPVQTKRH